LYGFARDGKDSGLLSAVIFYASCMAQRLVTGVAFDGKWRTHGVADQPIQQPADDVEPEIVRNLLQHVPLGASQTIVIARGPRMFAFRGALKQVEAIDVAVHVDEEWYDAGQTLRVQFMRLPLSPTSRLVLIFPLRDDYRLILVDSEDADLAPLRKLSNQLLGVLEVAGIGRKPV
jgi:hypothetical protein